VIICHSGKGDSKGLRFRERIKTRGDHVVIAQLSREPNIWQVKISVK
jgi:hypothetical protein